MKTIIEGNKEEKVQMSNKYIEEEKNNLFMNKPKKKFFNYDRKRRIKKVFRTFFIIITLVIYIGVLVVIGKSADYHFNTIYDEYEELDKEARYMVEMEMKNLTSSKNVYVHFLVVYKDIGDYFYEEKLPQDQKYVALIYNAMDKKFLFKSNIDYLVKDIVVEDVKDFKNEIPDYFKLVEGHIKENVYMTDFSTITKDTFGGLDKVEVVTLLMFGIGLGLTGLFILLSMIFKR